MELWLYIGVRNNDNKLFGMDLFIACDKEYKK